MQELEKILEEIVEEQRSYEADHAWNYARGLEYAADIIRKHMTAGWIPVDERLPEEPKENPEFEGKKIELYLVSVKGTKYPFRAMWNGKVFTDGWCKCEVIAWRPLPETYRPDRGKGARENE